ncbi:MAG: extracellular solute-binding protein [Lachnospiraceae bacterium]|nr:extracellular solute-binding protein [Lachnospiraceae bacterium]
MRFRNRLIVVALLISIIFGVLYIGNRHDKQSETSDTGYDSVETVILWYSDDSFTDFFINAAVAFHEKYSGIRVIPVLVDSSEYLEVINRASVKGDNFPDLFILSNDSLEKAYLAGLASEVTDPGNALSDGYFPKASLDAVTYHNRYVGYPLSFETSVLLYNKTYLENWAAKINAGGSASAGEGLSAEDMDFEGEDVELITPEVSEEKETETVTYEDYIPATVDDLLSFADAYEPEPNVASVIKWDVSDVFYNYYFVGNYMIVGGDAGDDAKNINIRNGNTIQCMHIYQNLNQFFSIDAEDSDAKDVLKDFIDGKMVYTIATSNAIAEINAASRKANEEYNEQVREAKAHNKEIAENPDAGDQELIDIDSIEKPMEYGYAVIPELSKELHSRSLSVTESVVVNGYSERKAAANKFAAFVASTYADQIYPRTGKLAASLNANYTDEAFVTFQKEYARSIPLPKIVETSNLWVQLEITFTKIWQGEDADEYLHLLETQMKSQLGER